MIKAKLISFFIVLNYIHKMLTQIYKIDNMC